MPTVISNKIFKVFLIFITLLIITFGFDKFSFSQSSSTSDDEIQDDLGATRDPFSLLKYENEQILTLSLRECISMGLSKNFTLLSSEIEPKIADADRELAESQFDFVLSARTNYRKSKQGTVANFFSGRREERWVNEIGLSKSFDTGTSVTLGFDYTHTDSDSEFQKTSDQAGFSLRVRQSLLKNFGLAANRFSIEVADISTQLAKEKINQSKLDLIYQIENAFWNEIFAIEDYNVTYGAMKLAEKNVEIFVRKSKAGLATNINVAAARTQLENKKRDLIDKAKEVRDASDTLIALIAPDRVRNLISGGAILIIKPKEYSLDISAELVRDLEVQKQINQALSRRPELKQSMLSKATAEARVNYRENQMLPDLSLIFGFSTSGAGASADDAFTYLWKTSNTNLEIGLEFSYPLGNRSAKSELAKAKYNLEKADFSHRTYEVEIITQVLRAIRRIQAARMTVNASNRARELAEKQLEAEMRRRDRGLATDFQVQEYENQLEEARRNEISARINLKLAFLELEKSTGTLPDRYKN